MYNDGITRIVRIVFNNMCAGDETRVYPSPPGYTRMYTYDDLGALFVFPPVVVVIVYKTIIIITYSFAAVAVVAMKILRTST